jgi:hypothetical protein
MLDKFSFKGLSKETKKEKRRTLDVSTLLPNDSKKSFGLSEEVVEYMISMGNIIFIRLHDAASNDSF